MIKRVFLFFWLVVFIFMLFLTIPILKNPNLLKSVDVAGINKHPEAIQFKNALLPLFFLILISGLFFIFKKKYKQNLFFFALVILLFIQSYFFGQKFIPFSNRQFLYPNHPVLTYLKENQGLTRFLSFGLGHIRPSIPLQFNLYSPEGISSMYLRRYGEFVRYMKFADFGMPDKIIFDLDLMPADVFNPYNKRLERFFELTSTKYIIVDQKSMVSPKIILSEKYRLVWQNDKWQIYEFLKAMPRFFITGDFEVNKDDHQILTKLFSDQFQPKKIILEKEPGFFHQQIQGKVTLENYSPNQIIIKTEASEKALLYLPDNYSPNFKVKIDGKKGEIYRANYTFRAVPIPQGKHQVVIVYDDTNELLYLAIAFNLFCVCGALTYVFRKYF